MSWYSKGASAARKARKKIKQMYRPEFWMKDGESAKLVFLDKEPLNLWMHQVSIRGRIRKYTCRGKKCPLCRVHDPRFISVYRVIDCRKIKTKTGKVLQYRESYYEAGARVAPQLEQLAKRKLLYRRVVEVTRTGEGTDTTYSFIPIGRPRNSKAKVSPKLNPLKDYEPKDLADLKLVAELLKGSSEDSYDDKEHAPKNRKTRSYYEEDDEEDYGDDYDEEGDDEEEGDDDYEDDEEEEEDDEADDDYEDDEEEEEERPRRTMRRRRRTRR